MEMIHQYHVFLNINYRLNTCFTMIVPDNQTESYKLNNISNEKQTNHLLKVFDCLMLCHFSTLMGIHHSSQCSYQVAILVSWQPPASSHGSDVRGNSTSPSARNQASQRKFVEPCGAL